MREIDQQKNEPVVEDLFVVDINPIKLLHEFWNRESDACPLEASEQEKQEKEWKKWIVDHSYSQQKCKSSKTFKTLKENDEQQN